MSVPLIETRGLSAGYGMAQVLFGIDLAIQPGEAVALIGRNGMGKTTLVRAIMGLIPAMAGSVMIAGKDMTSAPPFARAQAGLGLVPEGRQIFASLSVEENLIATARDAPGGWTLARIYDAFPRLKERRRNAGAQLSGGEQQMLAIGRALMTNPALVILDEATEGLAPLIRAEIWAILANLRAEGLAILVIDKNLDALAALADRFIALEKGHVVWQAGAASVRADPSQAERWLHL
ncbi:MAG: ABC transporter ATP-binding protein [Bosea sp. (in: a-proteobacteria)]